MKIQVEVIDEAIRRVSEGYNVYSCHAISDALRDSEHYHMQDHYLTEYVKFSGKRLGVPVDTNNSHCLNGDYGYLWQWWCDTSSSWLEAKIENLRLFKAAVERGEIK